MIAAAAAAAATDLLPTDLDPKKGALFQMASCSSGITSAGDQWPCRPSPWDMEQSEGGLNL